MKKLFLLLFLLLFCTNSVFATSTKTDVIKVENGYTYFGIKVFDLEDGYQAFIQTYGILDGDKFEITRHAISRKDLDINDSFQFKIKGEFLPEIIKIYSVSRLSKNDFDYDNNTYSIDNECNDGKAEFSISCPKSTIEKQKGIDVMFVIDRSRTMTTTFNNAKSAINNIIDSLDKSVDRVAITSFGTWGTNHTGFSNNFNSIKSVVNNLSAKDMATNIADGIYKAGKKFDDSGNDKMMIVLSDGIANAYTKGTCFGSLSYPISKTNCTEDALRQAWYVKKNGVKIYTVGYNFLASNKRKNNAGDFAKSLLKYIASSQSDFYIAKDNLNNLNSILENIINSRKNKVYDVCSNGYVILNVDNSLEYKESSIDKMRKEGSVLAFKIGDLKLGEKKDISFSYNFDPKVDFNNLIHGGVYTYSSKKESGEMLNIKNITQYKDCDSSVIIDTPEEITIVTTTTITTITTTTTVIVKEPILKEVNVQMTVECPKQEYDRFGYDLIFVLDNSGSMQGRRIRELKKVTSEFLRSNYFDFEKDRVSIITFNNKAGLLLDYSNDLDLILQKIEAMNPIDSTNIGDAMKLASDQFKKSDKKPKVIFFSDGAPTQRPSAWPFNRKPACLKNITLSNWKEDTCFNYSMKITDYIKNNGGTIYSIGFGISDNVGTNANIKNLGKIVRLFLKNVAGSDSRYFETNQDNLELAFDKIAVDIFYDDYCYDSIIYGKLGDGYSYEKNMANLPSSYSHYSKIIKFQLGNFKKEKELKFKLKYDGDDDSFDGSNFIFSYIDIEKSKVYKKEEQININNLEYKIYNI